MKAHKEFRSEISTCLYCGKNFYPRYGSKGKFCSTKCSAKYNSEKKYLEYLSNSEAFQGVRNISFLKPYILVEQNNRCAICNNPNIWNNQELVFVLDHINGRADDNSRANLRLICPNCDSQLDTFKSKNKNSARIYHKENHR